MITFKNFFRNLTTYIYSTELNKQERSILGNFIPVKSANETNNNEALNLHELFSNNGFTANSKPNNSAFNPTSSAL